MNENKLELIETDIKNVIDKKYEPEMQLYYVNIGPFQKQTQAYILLSTIGNSALNEFMKFSCWANMWFDEENDHKHRWPIIDELDAFTKNKTNCMVFDLYYNMNNNCKYDKLFIHNTNNQKEGTYGYLLYNSRTKKTLHRYIIEGTPDALCINLKRDFSLLYYIDKYEYYQKNYCDNNIKKYRELEEYYKERNKIKGYPLITVQEYWNQLNDVA